MSEADLNQWYRYPGNISGRDLLSEAQRRGWAVSRQSGDHVILSRAGFRYNLSIDLGTKANGTKRKIIKMLMEADDVDGDDGR
jgi:hypothetical protein